MLENLSIVNHVFLGKSKKLPFKRRSNYVGTPFERLYIDLWGSASSIWSSNRYFVLIVDKCTRYMWCYLIVNKDGFFVQFHL